MKNLIIPTTVVDGFFNNPDEVRAFALEQDYFADPQHMYPGKRSKPLHEINPELFQYVHNKFLSLFYPDVGMPSYSYVANASFQLIDSSYKGGWVHDDKELITVLIYLNENPNKESGTIIYSQKTEGCGAINTDAKHALFEGSIDEEAGEQYRLENNDRFQEEIVVKNRYNRLLAFDSNLFHGVKDFSNDEPRLTLISFITELRAKYNPIHGMHRTRI